MAEQITVTCKPTQQIYKPQTTYTLTAEAWDNDVDTYHYVDHLNPVTLLLDLSAIPKNAVIKKVRYRLLLYRTDNASYSKLQSAIGYADSLTNDISAQHRVTDYIGLNLTAYKTKEETSAEQTLTSEQSAEVLSAQYPILWFNNYGTTRYYEIYVDVTYEPDESRVYVGDKKATGIYVGDKQATAVYIGTTKVM